MKQAQAEAEETAKSGPKAKSATGNEQDDDLATRLNYYVRCLNDVDGTVHDNIDRYAMWVKDLEAGPTGKEKDSDVLGVLNKLRDEQCVAGLKQATAMVGKGGKTDDLDAAGAHYQAALEKLEPLTTQLYDYYDQKNYKDDAFKKGHDLNKPFVDATSAFLKASDELSDAVDNHHRELTTRELTHMEKTSGRDLAFLHKSLMFDAAELLAQMERREVKAEATEAAADAFLKLYDEFNAYDGQHKKDVDEIMMYDLFTERASDFMKQVKEVNRVLRSGKPFPEDGDGSRKQFISTYNEMIERSNGLRW
jgi:hypothetical protein